MRIVSKNGKARQRPIVFFLSLSAVVNRLLSGVAIGIILLTLLPLAVPYLENASSFKFIRATLVIDREIGIVVRRNFPTTVGGKDMTRVFVIVGMFIVSGMFSRMSQRSTDRVQYLQYKWDVDQWKSDMHLSDSAIVLKPLTSKLEELRSTTKRRDREQLLHEFADMKRRLDEMGRDLAFLAVDVADSTGMKQGEDRATVEHDFKEYKRFVERILLSHGALKSTWTPDGVMSCFSNVDAAVQTARAIINGLEVFNRDVKLMRRDFVVRCGVNSGFVYFDDSIPLEEISDRVIDVAGHMQKNAKPNTVCLAKPAIEPLGDRDGFEPAGRVVDGYEVYEWRKI
jgi:class 3 adenylate cyclase